MEGADGIERTPQGEENIPHPTGIGIFPDSSNLHDYMSVISSIDDDEVHLLEELRSKEKKIEELMARIEELEKNEISTDALAAAKKQYESKLKDVMEKAREHAKKLATERDDFKKLYEEKESKITHFKQMINEASVQMNSRDARIGELESNLIERSNIILKLEHQMEAVENHYTKPPSGSQVASLSVSEPNGTEWLLIDSRWWRRDQIPDGTSVSIASVVDREEPIRLRHQILELEARTERQETEFVEYRRKVELVLSEKVPPAENKDNGSSLQMARKVMKLEEELSQSQQAISRLTKSVSDHTLNEKSLLSQISMAKLEIHKLVEPVKSMETKISELEAEDRILRDKNTKLSRTITELENQLETARTEVNSSKNPITEIVEEKSAFQPIVSASVSTQTDVKPPALLMSTSAAPAADSPSPNQQQPQYNQSSLLSSQHDAVAIPLRLQIRNLITELEEEKRDHSLTIEQLRVVKEEMRRIDASKKLETDLTNNVKVEYMRNVARKFISLAPRSESPEFESLIPVILHFFGLEGDEAIALLKERQKRLGGTSSAGDSSSFSFPKIW